MSRAALKRAVVNAWRLEGDGWWIGYGGVQVRRRTYDHHLPVYEALSAYGAPLFPGARRFFPTAEQAFERIERATLAKGGALK